MNHFKVLKEAIGSALKPACEKYGFVTYRIVSHWEQIVGKHLAYFSFPIEIIFPRNRSDEGLLIIGVSNSGFALEIQASESIIISKLSSYFGYKAISRVRIKIAQKKYSLFVEKPALSSINAASKAYTLEGITEEEDKNLTKLIKGIKDPELAEEIAALKEILFFVDKSN
ncbi:MAG: DciA family protein [Candidatus Midichloria sp.]|nr:DciA family protein [Candidatus Midichloria sp.]